MIQLKKNIYNNNENAFNARGTYAIKQPSAIKPLGCTAQPFLTTNFVNGRGHRDQDPDHIQYCNIVISSAIKNFYSILWILTKCIKKYIKNTKIINCILEKYFFYSTYNNE